MYGGKTIESALARRTKVWIVASKFGNVSEHVHVEIWYTHDISLYYFCTLLAESVWYADLDGYQHSGSFCDFLEAFKQTHKVRPKTPRDLKEFFWATFTHFQQKTKKVLSFQEHTDLNVGNQ